MQSFDDLVAAFLAAEKVALNRPRWRTKTHTDYAVAAMTVAVPDSRLRGRMMLTAHRVRKPEKYGFALLFRNERIFALDVNPGHSHRNLFARNSVNGTHWQCWPLMEAEPDDASCAFGSWLQLFLVRAKIVTKFGVLSPPRGVQLELSRKWLLS